MSDRQAPAADDTGPDDPGGQSILISEVGPRDGLQNTSDIMPTDAKIAWVRALAAAGLREIEVGSFVSPKRLPQMADAAEVVSAATKIEGLIVCALVPNIVGAERAFAAGAHKVSIPVSASETHSRRNVGRSTGEMIEQAGAICRLRDRAIATASPAIAVEVGISTAFGCPFEGRVPEARVIEIAARLADAGVDSVGLSDTIGVANPAQVGRLFAALRSRLGDRAGGGHFHDTLGLGLANVVAALAAGVTTFDSSQAGLGGCPYAPGAAGNIVTEDLVNMLDAMGRPTGIDLDRLALARRILADAIGTSGFRGHVIAGAIPFLPLFSGVGSASRRAIDAAGDAPRADRPLRSGKDGPCQRA